jgi:transcriptional regulator with GAF, ATPase, and Fis domain
MSIDPGVDLARALVNVGRDLAEQPNVASTAERVVTIATKLTGCTWAALARPTSGQSVCYQASTDEDLFNVLASIDTDTGQGVTRHALLAAQFVAASDVGSDRRWPEYGHRVNVETPIRSALAYRLHLHETDLGTLALFADKPNFFSDALQDIAAVYADHASLALALAVEHERIANLERALDSNRTVAMAMGVLMAQNKITGQHAFDLLRTASQHSHRKLRELALDVIDTGQLNTPSTLSPLSKARLKTCAAIKAPEHPGDREHHRPIGVRKQPQPQSAQETADRHRRHGN